MSFLLLLPRYSGGVRFLVLPPAGYFLSDQKVTKESVRGGGFRFPPPPTPPPLKRPKKGACGPPPLDSSPGCSTTLLRCSVLTSSRTKHSIPLTSFVLALNSLRYFHPPVAPPPPHFRTDSTPYLSSRRWQSERRHVDQPRQRNYSQILQGGYPPEGPMAEVLRAEA